MRFFKYLKLKYLKYFFAYVAGQCVGVDSANRGQETYGGGSLRVSNLAFFCICQTNIKQMPNKYQTNAKQISNKCQTNIREITNKYLYCQ